MNRLSIAAAVATVVASPALAQSSRAPRYATNGCVMSSGRTHWSNCSAVRKPSLSAAS